MTCLARGAKWGAGSSFPRTAELPGKIDSEARPAVRCRAIRREMLELKMVTGLVDVKELVTGKDDSAQSLICR